MILAYFVVWYNTASGSEDELSEDTSGRLLADNSMHACIVTSCIRYDSIYIQLNRLH